MSPLARTLCRLPGRYAIHRFDPQAAVPDWALSPYSEFMSVTRTAEELSIIGPVRGEPDEDAWDCLKIEGPFTLDQPGVLASVVSPLAAAGMSVFAVATHDTDYLLVRDADVAAAALLAAGHEIRPAALATPPTDSGRPKPA